MFWNIVQIKILQSNAEKPFHSYTSITAKGTCYFSFVGLPTCYNFFFTQLHTFPSSVFI